MGNEQDTIRIQLVRLRDNGLLSTLDEPVDENLNTLLHLAVHVRAPALSKSCCIMGLSLACVT